MSDGRAIYPVFNSSPDVDRTLTAASADLGTALGLVRVLTLLPLFDPALSEVEALLARSWEALREARRLMNEERSLAEAHENRGVA